MWVATQAILDAVLVTGVGARFAPHGRRRTFQASIAGTGAVTATVLVEASNDDVKYLTLATIALSGTGSDSGGFATTAPWKYVRGNVTAIAGTGAAVTVTLGVEL